MNLNNCTICLVYGTDNKPLSKARVEVRNEGEMSLYFSNYKLRNIKIRTIVDFYDGAQGVVRCICMLVIRKNNQITRLKEPWMADCSVVKIREVFQRQKDLRVKTEIREEFQSDLGHYFPGTIQNISAGGLYVNTPWSMNIGDRFSFNHRFMDKLCDIRAEILRVNPLTGGGYGYGCKFVDLSLDTEAVIRKYVYTRQMEAQTERQDRQG